MIGALCPCKSNTKLRLRQGAYSYKMRVGCNKMTKGVYRLAPGKHRRKGALSMWGLFYGSAPHQVILSPFYL